MPAAGGPFSNHGRRSARPQGSLEYPGGHCLSAAAAGAVIAGEFGASAPPLVLQAKDALLQRFETPKQDVDDVSLSRTWLGVHCRLSVDVGIAMGTAIGKPGAQRHFLSMAKSRD